MPTIFKDWQQTAPEVDHKEIIRMYCDGFIGAKYDPEAAEALADQAEYAQASDVAHAYGFADAGKGRLSMPFIKVLEAYPTAWPGPAQKRGSCVLHNQRSVLLGLLCTEVAAAIPDEISGKVEGYPVVSKLAERNGVLAIEPGYWLRGHSGDGYSCPSAMKDSINSIGAVLRKDYSEFNINLEELDAKLAGKYWKKSQIPKELLAGFGRNLIRDSTFADEMEEVRDLLARDFILSTCGSEGFENKRDANGVSKRKGSWSHAMPYIAFDDRPMIIKLYGEPLVLLLNSWGVWNKGARDIVGSAKLVPRHLKARWIKLGIVNKKTGNIMIPEGSMWVRWSDVRRRTMIAPAGLSGWGRPKVDWRLNIR